MKTVLAGRAQNSACRAECCNPVENSEEYAYITKMANSISDFHRFAYLEDNFYNIRDYCNDNDIWLCQSLRRSGEMTFALARTEQIATELAQKFG